MKRKIDRVYFELTTLCNLKCTHCFNFNQNIKQKYLNFAEFSKFYPIIRNKTNGIVLTGGEPFLHPEIERFLELIKSEPVVVTTNATVQSKENLEKILKKFSNILLQISFDGMTKKSFEAVRGIGTYEKVKDTIDYLSKNGFSKRIGLSTSILSCNIHEVLDIIAYAKEKGLNSIHFPTLIMEGRCAEDRTILPDVESLNQLESDLLRLAVENEELNISVNTLNRVAGMVCGNKSNDCLTNATIKVTVDGKIMPCPVAWREEESLCNVSEISCYADILSKIEQIKQENYCEENCKECEANILCNMNFCEHCSIRKHVDLVGMKYRCSNLKYHINCIREEEIYDGKYVNDIYCK